MRVPVYNAIYGLLGFHNADIFDAHSRAAAASNRVLHFWHTIADDLGIILLGEFNDRDMHI
jgi:hypothetical protein